MRIFQWLMCFLLATALSIYAEAPKLPAPRKPPQIALDCDSQETYGRLCFPGGLTKAITFSFDDGREYDYKLVEIMNRYGLRGTFHLVSGLFDKPGYVKSKDVKALYARHEVASHTVNHANLPQQNDEKLSYEILQDRQNLEALVGYPIRGLAYPGGEADERVAKALPDFGIRYARVVGVHHWFSFPKSPYFWSTTCEIGQMLEDGKKFLSFPGTPALFSIWGHSYTFNDNKCWSLIEDFGKAYGNRKDIWYCTNIEALNYYDAARRLNISVDGRTIQNLSASPVWVSIGGKVYELKAGMVTAIDWTP